MITELLNTDCHCIRVERSNLEASLRRDLDDDELLAKLDKVKETLFADSPVFVSGDQVGAMRDVLRAVEEVTANDQYREQVLGRAPETARADPGTAGAFFGYDFHLTEDYPKLIEINTNAGGALLNLYLARAQKACCEPVAAYTTGALDLDRLEKSMVSMFRTEAELGGLEKPLETVAIVDQRPREQFLAPELELFRRTFEMHGVKAFVADPADLKEGLENEGLAIDGQRIDLIYNRLTDFYLEAPENRHLRTAYGQGTVLVTPGPYNYALYADKKNLEILSDIERLRDWGVDPAVAETLHRAVPRTTIVNASDAEKLWAGRKKLFFKPATSYGSRGAYDGAKLTKKTFQRILESEYVAQERVPPSRRTLLIDGEAKELKVDVRCFVYRGEIQFLAARLYRGQTTNLRTEGGGLATVFTTPFG